MIETPMPVYRKPATLRFMRSISWFGLVMSFLILLGEWHLREFLTVEFIGSLLAFPFFLIVIIARFRLDRDTRPFIELRPEGLLARDISSTVIEWADIEGVEISEVYGNKILNLMLSDTAKANLPMTWAANVTKSVNGAFGVSVASINLSGIDWDVDTLAETIDREAEAGRADLDALLPDDEPY